MMKAKATFVLLALLLFPFQVALPKVTATSSTPVGYWETISDLTKKPRSVVQIYELEGSLFGKVVESLVPGEDPGRLCTECSGEFHNQPVIGLRFLWGFKEKNGVWVGGRILDPDNGKIYKCKMKLLDDGQKLDVRGYIGISLIGRSQVWNRLKNYSPK